MSQRMIDVHNTINTVGDPDGEINSGTTSTTEDKGTTNRNATDNKKIERNNLRTSDIF